MNGGMQSYMIPTVIEGAIKLLGRRPLGIASPRLGR